MLRIGILGAAGIAPAAVIRPARRRTVVEVVAVASRRAASARQFAESHRIDRFYSDHFALLSDPGIDLIYNALPPSEHARWSIAALKAGKHVLCEKPFAMNADEAAQMLEAAQSTGNRLIEAFHDRYHPLSAELDAVKASGALGEILSLQADFSTSNPFDPASLRHDPRLGGGSLMDLGCYPVHWVRAFMNEEPKVVRASGSLNPPGRRPGRSGGAPFSRLWSYSAYNISNAGTARPPELVPRSARHYRKVGREQSGVPV